ncbi:puromycin-sensitive aminopeptidase-like isoform X2, partial [Leptotrombidium deliense]
NLRLPRTVIPKHYKITIKPNLTSRTFTGCETISLCLVNKTNEITVHSFGLNISLAKLTLIQNKKVSQIILPHIVYCPEEQTVTFVLPDSVSGSGKLYITFSGKLHNHAVRGFYASKYNVGDSERYEAVTQFQPISARKAFPCFDEPNIKATFSISLIVPNGRVALSNMPQISNVSVSDTESKITFKKSPRMSTYLVAFVVGEYDYLERNTSDGKIVVRAYTPVGQSQNGEFALNTTIKAVEYFQKYFGIDYPLPKLDLVAINEYDGGAMENWGLMTFKKVNMILDPKSTPLAHKQYVASLVVHEVAHQWFGNLVTMNWWSQLWLNEG